MISCIFENFEQNSRFISLFDIYMLFNQFSTELNSIIDKLKFLSHMLDVDYVEWLYRRTFILFPFTTLNNTITLLLS